MCVVNGNFNIMMINGKLASLTKIRRGRYKNEYDESKAVLLHSSPWCWQPGGFEPEGCSLWLVRDLVAPHRYFLLEVSGRAKRHWRGYRFLTLLFSLH